jgi:hypothetical protein
MSIARCANFCANLIRTSCTFRGTGACSLHTFLSENVQDVQNRGGVRLRHREAERLLVVQRVQLLWHWLEPWNRAMVSPRPYWTNG